MVPERGNNARRLIGRRILVGVVSGRSGLLFDQLDTGDSAARPKAA